MQVYTVFKLEDRKKIFTARQLEVLNLYALGFSATEIANRLGITQRAVHFHLSRIRERCMMSTRGAILNLIINDPEFRNELASTAHVVLPSIDIAGLRFTSKEIEVLKLIHLSDSKIASKLRLSKDTVHFRLERIRKKLNVKKQTQVILRIAQLLSAQHEQLKALYLSS